MTLKQRVVVTGIGVVTPLGSTLDQFWHGLTEGLSAAAPISLFDASRYPVSIAAEVKDFDLFEVGENPRQWENAPRQTAFTIGAGIRAMDDAGMQGAGDDPTRCGVYLGCGEPFTPLGPLADEVAANLKPHVSEAACQGLGLFNSEAQRQFDPSLPAISLSSRFNFQGPSINCIAACVSATQAIGEAVRMIRRDDADVMLCGGGHSCIHELGVTGFSRLSALSGKNDSPQTASRPFDLQRDGFVMGEGAAVLVLESMQHAVDRRATIYGEVSGYASSQDAYRVTDAHPQGRGSASAMTKALRDASVNIADVDYICAHGTGTVLNDKIETQAIKSTFGDDAYRVPVSSIKSMIGHATTACGALETAACLLALRDGVVPPTINYETPDPECDLDYVPNAARELSLRHIVNNNIGFGGQNAALVLSRFDRQHASQRAA